MCLGVAVKLSVSNPAEVSGSQRLVCPELCRAAVQFYGERSSRFWMELSMLSCSSLRSKVVPAIWSSDGARVPDW